MLINRKAPSRSIVDEEASTWKKLKQVPCSRLRSFSAYTGEPPRSSSQFADQVIRSAVTSIERAYHVQAAVEGQKQLRELADTDPLLAQR